MDEPLHHEDFAPYVGRRFGFAEQHVVLKLATITPAPHAAMPGTTRTPFILVFHGPVGDILPEGLHRAQVEDGPALEFYVMPIHTVVAGRQDYQAVFN